MSKAEDACKMLEGNVGLILCLMDVSWRVFCGPLLRRHAVLSENFLTSSLDCHISCYFLKTLQTVEIAGWKCFDIFLSPFAAL